MATKQDILKEEFRHLSSNDRIQIEIEYGKGKSYGEIAKHLGYGRNKSIIFREIADRPNKGMVKYQAYISHCQFIEREKSRGKRGRLKNDVCKNIYKGKTKNLVVSRASEYQNWY